MSVYRALRSSLFFSLDVLQLPRLLLSLGRKNRGTIVLYHGVTGDRGNGIFNYRNKFITPEAFRYHISWLKRHFTILPLEELVEQAQNGALAGRPLALTFDDGYINNYTYAYPILREMSVPATFFVTTKFIEERCPLPGDVIEYAIGMTKKQTLTFGFGEKVRVFPLHTRRQRIEADLALRNYHKKLSPAEAEDFLKKIVGETDENLGMQTSLGPYQPLSWAAIQEMERGGMTFASHTHTHAILSHATKAEAREEIITSKQLLAAHLKNPLPVFAYPNGSVYDYTRETIELLKETGFKAALTTTPRALDTNDTLFELPRYTLDGTNEPYRLRITISGIHDALHSTYRRLHL